jgi:uncharacterized membrane protein YraQ (UPF0718 family)
MYPYEKALDIMVEFWRVLNEMAPYLLFGFFIAGLLSRLFPQRLVERHLGGGGFVPVLKAALIGIPLPLCSCSVIPVTASLRKHGASRGASIAFLISTPQTGIDSIFVTLSLLGPLFAVFRPLAAFVSGLCGGALAAVTDVDKKSPQEKMPPCTDECCAKGGGRTGFLRAIHFGFITLPRDIGRSLIIGVAVAGVIAAFIPEAYFAGSLGTGIGGMLVMMLLGMPLYVCATASVPIAAALMSKGVSPGAALVFLTTGAATNAATIATTWKLMGPRATVIYLVTVLGTAFASGFALNHLFIMTGASERGAASWMLPMPVKAACAIGMLILLGYGFVRGNQAHTHPDS